MNSFYPIFRNIIPYEPYKLSNKPLVFLLDIDKDQVFEIIGVYKDEYFFYFIILKYMRNKWCHLTEKKLELSDLKKIKIKKTNSDLFFILETKNKQIRKLTYKDQSLVEVNPDEERHQVSLYPAYINGIGGKMHGYINDCGQFKVEPQFEVAGEFQENSLAIVKKGLYGIIHKTAEYLLKPTYESIRPFNNQRAIILDKNGYGVIDEQGKLVTRSNYDYINDFKDDRALFYNNKNGELLYGYLDADGNEVIQPIYQNGTDFVNGKAVVQLSDYEFYLINPNGKVLQKYNYAFVGQIGEHYLVFKQTKDGLYGYIDESGKVVLPPVYTNAFPFIKGRAIVSISEWYGIIDYKGNFIIKPIYDMIKYLGCDRYALGTSIEKDKPYLGYSYALATINGELLTSSYFKQIHKFIGPITSVYDDYKSYFIDLNGTKLNQLPTISGQGIMEIVNKIIKVNVDYREFYLDEFGNSVYQPNDVIPVNDEVLVEIKTYKPNINYLVYYPVLTGVKERIIVKLKEKSQINEINQTEHLDYSYYGNFIVSFYENRLLSIKFEGYHYPFGAAHGMPYLSYCHIDLEKSICFELRDLFKTDVDYVKVINGLIQDKIKKDNEYTYLFPNAFTSINRHQPFFIDHQALYLYFQPYEIAPYAAGFPTFKISFDEIKDIINDEGDFWNAFHSGK